MLKTLAKVIFPGVSWSNPFVNFIFKLIDPFDFLVRSTSNLRYLPPFSIRVRSNGVNGQFGGKRFYSYGRLISSLLKDHAGLKSSSEVLEIGCGCGRTAYALTEILDSGKYTGMDIEKVSLSSCKENSLFRKKEFDFHFMDVQNDEYNPNGKNPANTYQFPYEDKSFDIIFLVSVFTHMITDDVRNYIKEISRMLKPGGVCLITTFLMDKGKDTARLSFPLNKDEHFFYDPKLPEIALGYYSKFYVNEFAKYGAEMITEPLWGTWRERSDNNRTLSQDVILFQRQ